MSSHSSLQSEYYSENDLLEDFFEISDHLTFSEEIAESCPAPLPPYQPSPRLLHENGDQMNMSDVNELKPISHVIENRNQNIATDHSRGTGTKVAFRTKSHQDILDDGYRWRKYGKKMMKNSPNPRNYYRCFSEGCNVKKRIQRERGDPQYVITTYEGIHNHRAPISVANNKASANHIP